MIEGFEALGVVDEVIVVNNNAEPGTSEEVSGTSAREIHEPRQGYGAAIRRGIEETAADLICICEPDGTFDPSDLLKLPPRIPTTSISSTARGRCVISSGTAPTWAGTSAGGTGRSPSSSSVLFNTASLTDIGCTMRLVSGPAVRGFAPHFTVSGGAFGPEMMILSVISGTRIVQLPVNYRARVGTQGTTEHFVDATKIGLQMIGLIVRYRLRRTETAEALRAAIEPLMPNRDSVPKAGGEPMHMFPRLRKVTPREIARGFRRRV